MVVADQTMVEKYGSDLEHYLLTIMGGANRIFSHPSLGLIVSLSVTKVKIKSCDALSIMLTMNLYIDCCFGSI